MRSINSVMNVLGNDHFKLRSGYYMHDFPRWAKLVVFAVFTFSNILVYVYIFLFVSDRLNGSDGPGSPLIRVSPAETRTAISSDGKSILLIEEGRSLLSAGEAREFLIQSGYLYNSETFNTDPKARYEGDCFTEAVLSPHKDQIVFSSGCIPGDLPQPWIGTYDIREKTFRFLKGGGGSDFVWSRDGQQITYNAFLGLSGEKEKRTISSNDGKIIKIWP